MTTKTWDEMTGRERDAMVAEKVMGRRVSWWSLHPVGSFAELEGREWRHTMSSLHAAMNRNDEPGEVKLPDGDGDSPVLMMHDEDKGWVAVPPLTTDIAAAWQVVEEMARRGYTLVCEWKGADREYAHTAEAYFRKSIYTHGHAVADTAPLAICRAALAVIDSQETER